ncbi:hypothetical protein EG240_06885 [Paenimyroides tangerinum]|uniref:Protease complex subunit PrcB family protein n=1 Tax=Paenimyroides tangerinum TaxID=2488728 RepID=A0A3P3WF87_9FLAO|nr:hypothetical protein [Paenimyroides tangerinum]RRJ91223.1 hypothetical protein EG240_06885 [Paenimyroides tangerinum]
MKNLIYLVLSLFVLTACSNDDNDVIANDVQFTTVGKNTLHGGENIPQSNFVFNNETDWNNFLIQVNAINDVSGTFNETEIDFTAFTVIAVVDEVKTSGSQISIINVMENTNNIQIAKELTIYSTTVISQPFHIIKIPKTNKPIIFN